MYGRKVKLRFLFVTLIFVIAGGVAANKRIRSMLILALFFAMYLIAWRIYEKEETVFKITTFITVVGIINVPITKYSVEWWNTLHQPASINILKKAQFILQCFSLYY